jgi:hypothetical protein
MGSLIRRLNYCGLRRIKSQASRQRGLELAVGDSDPLLKEHLKDAAQRWTRIDHYERKPEGVSG